MEWLESNKIPSGRWLADFVDFLNDYLPWLFDGFTYALENVFDLTSWVLLSIPGRGRDSSRQTVRPDAAMVLAAARPTRPPPATTTSTFSMNRCCTYYHKALSSRAEILQGRIPGSSG